MRVRLFAEVEVSDEALLKQFGMNLPNVTAGIPDGLARNTETLMKGTLGQAGLITAVRVVAIPELL